MSTIINDKERAKVQGRHSSKHWKDAALSTLIKLSNIIAFLPVNLNKTLTTVVEEVYRLFNPGLCCIYMISNSKNFELVAFRTTDGNVPDFHIDSDTEACASLRDSLLYVASGAMLCPNRKVTNSGEESHVCIPMMSGSGIFGVLSVSFQLGRVLNRDELNVLLFMANQASVAIQRFRLIERLKSEKVEIERAYGEISKLNEMLRRKIEELRDTMGRG